MTRWDGRYHDEHDPDLHTTNADYEPSNLTQALVMATCTLVVLLAMYGAADILGRLYAYTGG